MSKILGIPKRVLKLGKPLYRAVKSAPRTLDTTARTIEFTSSTESSDRYGDVIRVAGWNLDNFQKNPVFLFSHRSEDPPIGKVLDSQKVVGKSPALVQTVQFMQKADYPFADTIFKMYQKGFMNAVSVGFMPIEVQPVSTKNEDGDEVQGDGYEFLEQELFELSAVPVPANPEALGRLFKSASAGSSFDATKLGEMFLREAVAQNVIESEEATRVEKFICGDKNPPWAYNIDGVTVSSEEESDVENEKSFGEWKEASSKCMKKADEMVSRVEKAVLVIEDFSKKLSSVPLADKITEIPGEAKSVIPFAHHELAPDDETWDAGKEMDSAASKADWKTMNTVIEGDPDNKTSYKLPHHKGPGGKFATVRRGVANALARLEQTEMAEADRAGARSHLTRHLDEFHARDGEKTSFDASEFERTVKGLGELLRGSKSDMVKAFILNIIEKYVQLGLPPVTKGKGGKIALGYMQSAHKDLSAAHKKTSLAIGHLNAENGDDDPADEPWEEVSPAVDYAAPDATDKLLADLGMPKAEKSIDPLDNILDALK
jgi:uncharacterized protein